MIVCGVLAASTASATSCQQWKRMSEDRRWDRIDRMIEDAITGQKGRSYHVDRGAIQRCLVSNSQNMFWDFDELCSDSRTGGMSAIRTRFKQYIWTCVN
jgi:hypothetical protein